MWGSSLAWFENLSVSEMNDDEELTRALEESARMHSSSSNTLFFSTQHSISRNAFDSIPSSLLPKYSNSDQLIHKVDLFNQFHSTWKPLIRKYKTPNAICGYTSVALAIHILRKGITFDTLDDVVQFRKQIEADQTEFSLIMSEVGKVMKFIYEDRQKYVLDHRSEFRSKAAEKSYLSNWVANYEISDYFVHLLEEDRSNELSEAELSREKRKQMIFFRFNEYPELSAATHEEKRRIEKEMKVFGGEKGDKGGTLSYGEGEHMFVIERFCSRRLLPPEMAMKEKLNWLAGVVDLNGHFCAVVPTRKEGVVLLDTTQGNYLTVPIIGVLHEMHFASLKHQTEKIH